jgi:hypothetical protein
MTERPASHEELLESHARSFTSAWWVADDYVVKEGFVIPLVAGKPIEYIDVHRGLRAMKQYMPMAHPELPAEFAKVDGGGRDAALTFVRRYGLPGLWRFQLGKARPNGPEPLCGDPLAWILAHARAVRLVGDLASELDNKDALVQRLEELRATDGTGWPIVFPFMPHEARYPSILKMKAAATPRETALRVIAWQLNDALRNVSRCLGLVGVEPPRLESRFIFEDLIACIYWLLADHVVGGTIRRCRSCGRFFAATSDRVKYCPPPMGIEGPSRCMNRDKVRRWRQDQEGRQQDKPRKRRQSAGRQRGPRR